MKPKVTASSSARVGDGVGSNRRRTSSLQDDEPVQFTPAKPARRREPGAA